MPVYANPRPWKRWCASTLLLRLFLPPIERRHLRVFGLRRRPQPQPQPQQPRLPCEVFHEVDLCLVA